MVENFFLSQLKAEKLAGSGKKNSVISKGKIFRAKVKKMIFHHRFRLSANPKIKNLIRGMGQN